MNTSVENLKKNLQFFLSKELKLIFIVVAIVINILMFVSVNLIYIKLMKSSYQNLELNPKTDFTVFIGDEKVFLWENKHLNKWLLSLTSFSDTQPFNARNLIKEMFETIGDSNSNVHIDMLDKLMQGDLSWSILLYLKSRYISGEEIFDIVTSLENNQWKKFLYSDEFGQQKKTFIIHCIQVVVNKQNSDIRTIKRWNGNIQWIIGFLSWFLVCLLFYRSVNIFLSAPNVKGGNINKIVEPLVLISPEYKQIKDIYIECSQKHLSTTKVKEKIRNTEEIVTKKIYVVYHFLLSTIPSFGFIGTVLGMGEALLKSDSLFAAQSKQQQQLAVSKITQELGYAFDTTLVALIASIFVGFIIVIVQRQEYTHLKNIEQDICEGCEEVNE